MSVSVGLSIQRTANPSKSGRAAPPSLPPRSPTTGTTASSASNGTFGRTASESLPQKCRSIVVADGATPLVEPSDLPLMPDASVRRTVGH
jgi:hypothetical protein